MQKWLYRLLWVPVFAFVVLFLIANRRGVAISLDPFSASAPTITTPVLPLWFWLSVMVLIGFAAGAIGVWVSGREKRVQIRAERRELKNLRKEVTALRTQLDETNRAASQDGVPALSVDNEPARAAADV